MQYIAECFYNFTEESDRNWHGVCVALEPVTEMLMSFLMSLPPSAAAASDLYAVAAAFFTAGGAAAPPAVFAQDLEADEGVGAAEPLLYQGDAIGAGNVTPTASVGGEGMSVGSQQIMSPALPPPSLARPPSVSKGVEGGRGAAFAATNAVPKR